jgi:asparagine synthase (glutamine-hydrolysing)
MIPESFKGKIRQESYIDFITYGFIPAPFTMFENVKLLEPGSYISFSMVGNNVKKTGMFKYWSPVISNEIDNTNEAIEFLSYELEKSVTESLLASTEIACLFSGGVDSSLIFSYARDIDKEICAITADFGDQDDASERSLPLIHSYNHKNHILKEINKQDVDKSLSYLADICESPFDDTSVIPSNIVFQTVKSQGYRVALTGDGADELFCGYESFSKLNKMSKILNPKFDSLRGGLNSIFDVVPDKFKDTNFQRFFMDENSLLIDLSCNGFKKRAWGSGISSDYDPLHHVERLLKDYDGMDVISKFRMLNLSFRLPNQMLYKVDRTSMFNSVEARPVFLNNRIVELALKISSRVMMQNGTKGLLKQICSKKLPTKEWKMPKTGFGWKTDSYSNIFNSVDDQYLYQATKIKGSVLLRNKRSATKKRGYYGLRSLVIWQKNLSNTSKDGLL